MPDRTGRNAPRQRAQGLQCTAPGCMSGAYCKRLCTRHYQRMRNRGELEPVRPPATVLPPEQRKRGAEHHSWRGDAVGYRRAHERVAAARGRAEQHVCVDCGGQAREWSYDNSDPNEQIGESNGFPLRYSTDVQHYEPRCIPCHKRFDLKHIAEVAA